MMAVCNCGQHPHADWCVSWQAPSQKRRAQVLPPIFVRVPVSSPLHLTGTADVFEAQFVLDVTVDNKVVQHHEVYATSGSGTRGSWELTLELPPGKCILHLYEPSARDGTPTNEVRVPLLVTLGQAADADEHVGAEVATGDALDDRSTAVVRLDGQIAAT